MSDPIHPTSTTATNPNAGVHAPPPHTTKDDDGDIVYYEGSPKLRGELGTLFLWTILGLIAIAVPLMLYSYGQIVSLWPVVIGVLVGLVLWIMPSLLVRKNYYKITNYRIDYESGLLFKKMDTLELWHVEDVSLSQSPIDRMFNVGTITVISGDATTPRLELHSLHDPRKMLELLKTRIIAVKRQRGVIKMDLG